MNKITSITSEYKQSFLFNIDGGSTLTVNLYYYMSQYSWYMDLIYGDWELNGYQVVLHPNILRQFRNQIPFGIAFVSTDGIEPVLESDFADDRVSMYILNSSEVEEIENVFYGSDN